MKTVWYILSEIALVLGHVIILWRLKFNATDILLVYLGIALISIVLIYRMTLDRNKKIKNILLEMREEIESRGS